MYETVRQQCRRETRVNKKKNGKTLGEVLLEDLKKVCIIAGISIDGPYVNSSTNVLIFYNLPVNYINCYTCNSDQKST